MDGGDGDVKAVLLAIAGSEDAYELLVRRHQHWLLNLLRRISGNTTAAEDLSQIVFVNAWLRMGALRDATLFRPWLRRIAINAAVDAARKGLIVAESLDQEALEAAPRAHDRPSDCKLDIDAAMARLSFAQRACVHLSLVEGMSHGEIASALQMPIGTVKSHLARALPMLRFWLKDWKTEHV